MGLIDFKKILSVILILLISISSVSAQNNKSRKHKISKQSTHHVKPPIPTALVADAKTGKILYAHNPHQKIFPASLAKMMNLYIVFGELKKKSISMNTKLNVSEKASYAKPSKLGLAPGQTISVGDAVLALIVKSANDVAVVLAENIGGSEEQFAKIMNAKAKALGMRNTHYANASGWHDKRQVTTASDLLKLAMALKRDFPEYYHLFKKTNFTFRGQVIHSHNHLLKSYEGAEGLKTGYTGPAGFNLVTTASKNGMCLVGIVTGSPSAKARNNKMATLLDKHFGITNNDKYYAKNDNIKAKSIKNTKITKSKNIRVASANNKSKKRIKSRA